MRSSARFPWTLLALTTLGGVFGCELVASVDRSKLPGEETGASTTVTTSGAGGGTTTSTSHTGGSGGTTTTTAAGGSGGTTTTGTGGSGGTTTTGTGGSGGTTTTGSGGHGGTGGVGGGTGGAGGHPECGAPSDCPGADTECGTRTCDAGVCGFSYAAAGTAVAKQVAGDCQLATCDGQGGTTSTADDTDLPVDGNECTEDVCKAGVASNPPTGAGSACSKGGSLCDGNGSCAECLSATDCAGAVTECQHPTCDLGKCGTKIQPVGAPVAAQTAGDCLKNQCDGFGDVQAVPDDTDVWDDGNDCTTESCSAGKKVSKPKASGAACGANGALFCDGAGACKGCVDASNCAAPQNPCMVAVCQNGACGSANKQNGAACDDGNACTKTDTCQAGACTGGNAVVCSASDSCHDAGTCDSKTGACSNPAKADGAACSDGNACTKTDACQAGVCTGSNPVTCSALDACHDVGICNAVTGACSNPAKQNGTSCNDGNACTKTDTCQAGVCTGANPVTCAAQDQCHDVGTCDAQTGTCSNPAKQNGASCNDGNACTKTDTCQAGACTGGNAVVCSASDSCHDAGLCDPQTGACSNPAKQNGASCSDGNACTQADTCQAGVCTGGNAVTCQALGQCYDVGTCDSGTGQCSHPKKADGTPCDDGNPATLNDTCLNGLCGGENLCTNVTCTALDACHDAGTCDPQTGLCSNPPKQNGSSCNDGNPCTQTDTCQAGVCTGSNPVVCGALDQCHVAGTCDPQTGACSNPVKQNGAACNDGDACTQTDTCQAGACTGSNAVVCGPLDACHVAGTCDPKTGACSNPAAVDGTACNDGDKCTQTDTCQAGACTGSNPVICSASDQCHDAGTCDPVSGACSNPAAVDGTACNDGDKCTQTDTCQAGVCHGGNAVVCITLEQCKDAGTCDPQTGLCSAATPVADGKACDDGDKCTQTDACSAGLCAGSNPVVCSAPDECHDAGTCNAGTGVCGAGAAKAEGTACTNGVCTDVGLCSTTNLVVMRVGTGAAALSSSSTALFLDKMKNDGTAITTFALPTATNAPNYAVTGSGTATSEGGVTRSPNGKWVIVTGYAAAPGVASIAGTTSAANPRIIARVDPIGGVDSTTHFDAAFSGANIRSGATSDGDILWASGSTGGVYAIARGNSALLAPTQVLATPSNVRFLGISANQLYGTSSTASYASVFAVGAGLPIVTGGTATPFNGIPVASGPSPYGFAIFDRKAAVAGRDTIYLTDDRATASGGGVVKYVTADGATWTFDKTITTGLSTGVRGLCGYLDGTSAVLFVTTTETSGNKLVRLVEDGAGVVTATTVSTAAANTAYRGCALAPQ
jgi:hypothetical protein